MAAQDSKALAISPVTSLMRRDVGAIRQAITDRPAISDATMIVSRMLRGYANGGAQASGGYIGALAAVLVTYPRVIAEQSADPVHGVPRETRFLPTPADVIAWCERALAELRKPVDQADLEAAALKRRRQGIVADRKLAADRAARPTLKQMQEKHGEHWGIGEGNQEDLIVKARTAAKITEANRRMFERECRAANIDPARGCSPELVHLLKDEIRMRKAEKLGEEADRIAGEAAE